MKADTENGPVIDREKITLLLKKELELQAKDFSKIKVRNNPFSTEKGMSDYLEFLVFLMLDVAENQNDEEFKEAFFTDYGLEAMCSCFVHAPAIDHLKLFFEFKNHVFKLPNVEYPKNTEEYIAKLDLAGAFGDVELEKEISKNLRVNMDDKEFEEYLEADRIEAISSTRIGLDSMEYSILPNGQQFAIISKKELGFSGVFNYSKIIEKAKDFGLEPCSQDDGPKSCVYSDSIPFRISVLIISKPLNESNPSLWYTGIDELRLQSITQLVDCENMMIGLTKQINHQFMFRLKDPIKFCKKLFGAD